MFRKVCRIQIILRRFSLHFTQKRVNLHWKVRKNVSIIHKIELSSVIYEKDRQEMSMIDHHKRINIDLLFGFFLNTWMVMTY